MESHRRRSSSSIDPASVESILTSGAPQPAAPPSPHVGDSPNRAQFAMFPPPRPAANHSRALSYTSRRPNRLSLSFPVATNTNGIDSGRGTPTSSNQTSFPPTPAEMVPAPSPNDPSGFLVALAGQERRVLELKEELHKAETDLLKLKKQWAIHEAHKKKAEIRHVEPMRQLQSASPDGDNSSEGGTTSTRQSAELDRRKALLSNINIPKESRRKVMTGGHTRTLSLLSPERSNYPRPFPPVRESSSERQDERLLRSTTMPDTSQGISRVSTLRARPLSYQSGVTLGAKQIAEDIKAGMWTFIEDLRQATVAAPALDDLDDWSAWDSPTPKSPRWSGSTTVSDPATPSNGSIDDRAVKIAGETSDGTNTPSKRDEIQWPALDKLTPTNLKQTMSSMMKEWEKSIAPPLEEQKDRLMQWTVTSTTEEATHTNAESSEGSDTTTGEALMMTR
ncbi:hypothetical protein G7Y89_g11586 [Cudoniella acicularis]|uniref:DUF4048 domain-containing protein n=1 Tax=Cudoniella acicularis TaxID=354080 RepID=A0A8H4RD77_9HELO|nr:hypothetical protein G7Y89_g11586 [Cudoniella acicularis]